MAPEQLNIESTVGEWVGSVSARARILEGYGIDYCCGGKKSLRLSCQEKGLPVAEVIEALESAGDAAEEVDWACLPLNQLCDHIEDTHHLYLKRELPRLQHLAAKTVSAHGEAHPELLRVQRVLFAFTAEVEEHLAKEEQILFPLIRGLANGAWSGASHCGTIANPIRVMEMEHDNAGAALAEMRSLTSGYAPPADACPTYRQLLQGLAELEQDMHQHVHKENNFLFPAALAGEAALAPAA